MDDHFSGLTRPHIDAMKLDEEDWGSNNKEDKQETPEPTPPPVYTPEEQSDGGPADDQSKESKSDDDRAPVKNTSSTSSSSSSSDRDAKESSEGPSTLDEFRVPLINYERDYPSQSLIAMIGREFDEPWVISASLQALAKGAAIDGEPSKYPKIKFVPYTVRRNILTKGSIDPKDISRHDVICMCYNASEARIMLTGRDGYYTELLKHVEALHGNGIQYNTFIMYMYSVKCTNLLIQNLLCS